MNLKFVANRLDFILWSVINFFAYASIIAIPLVWFVFFAPSEKTVNKINNVLIGLGLMIVGGLIILFVKARITEWLWANISR